MPDMAASVPVLTPRPGPREGARQSALPETDVAVGAGWFSAGLAVARTVPPPALPPPRGGSSWRQGPRGPRVCAPGGQGEPAAPSPSGAEGPAVVADGPCRPVATPGWGSPGGGVRAGRPSARFVAVYFPN